MRLPFHIHVPLLLGLLAMSVIGCRSGEPDRETPLERARGVRSLLESIDDRDPPPAITYLDHPASERDRLIELLGATTPAAGQTEATVSTLRSQILESVPVTGVGWEYSLGLAPVAAVESAGFRPALLFAPPGEPTPLALTSVCLEGRGECSACQPTVGRASAMDLKRASFIPAIRSRPEDPPPEVQEFENICATIATAWSLVKLGAYSTSTDAPELERAWTLRDDGGRLVPDKWNRGLLRVIKGAQAHDPEVGTFRIDVPRAYEAFGGSCEAEQTAPADSAGLKRWCEGLVAGNEEMDYHFSIGNGESAHGMNVVEVRYDADAARCEIVVHDTGRQGGGGGDDVDVLTGFQEWHVGTAGGAVSVEIQRGITGTTETSVDFAYWSGRRPAYNRASYICCSIPEPDDDGG